MIQIKDYPNYYVTDEGFIYSEKNNIILKGGLDKDGYSLVTLQRGMLRRTAKVHREVAIAYVPNPDKLPVVNHIDGNKINNHPSNLEWTTVSGNTKHAYVLGSLCQKGEANNACKYPDDIVNMCISLHCDKGVSIKALSSKLGIKYATIYSWVSGVRRSQSSTTIPEGSTSEAIADGSGAAPKGV